jgi:hypothetical protein
LPCRGQSGKGQGWAIGELLSNKEHQRRWFSVGFGGGIAVALDEIALVVEDQDVYWNREWVPMAKGLAAMTGAVALAGRFLQRGVWQWEGARATTPRVVERLEDLSPAIR